MRYRLLAGVMALAAPPGPAFAAGPAHFVHDALGGTLARDHQSRAMYFQGKHRRTYVTYMDHDFGARITYYDHDVKRWAEIVRVDDCIAETGWCKGLKDGHNVPNLWVSRSGTIHLIYGSHGTPFKYARSERPEDISRWKLGKRISNYATYPFFAQLPDGEMLMFYRYGPTGGYKNPFLAFQRTADEGPVLDAKGVEVPLPAVERLAVEERHEALVVGGVGGGRQGQEQQDRQEQGRTHGQGKWFHGGLLVSSGGGNAEPTTLTSILPAGRHFQG